MNKGNWKYRQTNFVCGRKSKTYLLECWLAESRKQKEITEKNNPSSGVYFHQTIVKIYWTSVTFFTCTNLNLSFQYLCHQFLSISYWSNNLYWSQKRTQNGNNHSTKLDVYAEKQSASNLSFFSFPFKQGRKYYSSSLK